MNDDDAVKYAIHNINAQAHSLNKDIVQKSATMQDIPLNKEIYEKPPPVQPQPQIVPPPQVGQVASQVQVHSYDPALLNTLIERVCSVEKQITKFVDLIEKRVAKNAKEINIRIKLDDKNDSTNKE